MFNLAAFSDLANQAKDLQEQVNHRLDSYDEKLAEITAKLDAIITLMSNDLSIKAEENGHV